MSSSSRFDRRPSELSGVLRTVAGDDPALLHRTHVVVQQVQEGEVRRHRGIGNPIDQRKEERRAGERHRPMDVALAVPHEERRLVEVEAVAVGVLDLGVVDARQVIPEEQHDRLLVAGLEIGEELGECGIGVLEPARILADPLALVASDAADADRVVVVVLDGMWFCIVTRLTISGSSFSSIWWSTSSKAAVSSM